MSEYHSFKNTLESLGYSLLTDIESFGVVGRVKFECNGGHQNDLAKSTFYKKQKELERTGTTICAKCNGVTKGSPRKGDDEVSARTMRRRQEEKKLPPAIVVPRHLAEQRTFTSRMTIEQKFDVFLNFLQSQGYTMDSDFDGFSGGRRIQWTCNNGHSEDWKLDTFSKTKKKCEETGSILCKKCIGSKAGRPSGITPTSTDSAYNAYKRFLESIGYKIVIDFDTFMQSSDKDTARQVMFVCDQGHETTVAAAVFNRKRRGYENDGTMLCNDCTGRGKRKDVDVKLEELRKLVFEMNGHHVIASNGMVVSHKCGLCDEINESWESNIRSKTTSHCRKCKSSEMAAKASVSRPVKKPEFGIGVFLNFKKYLEEHGYEMVSDFEMFKENEMSFRCDEGHITTMKVTSFNNRKHSDLIKNDSERLCHDCNGDCRTLFQKKPFVFPSGRVDDVMGYEPRCLEKLLKTYDENDIVTSRKKIPVFKFEKEKDGKSSDGTYYPDILVKDKIIEVKSKFTFLQDRENNLSKFNAVASQGHDLECWIYDKDNLEILKFPKTNHSMVLFESHSNFLTSIGYHLVSDFENFQKTKICFKCDRGHTSEMSVSSFTNKRSFFEHNTIVCICQECSKNENFEDRFQNLRLTVFEKSGHEILELNKEDKSLTFKCGKCGEISSNWETNFKKEILSKYCIRCVQKPKRKEKEVQKILDDLSLDYDLLEYTDNKHVQWKCKNGHIFNMAIFDIKRGRRCLLCKKEAIVSRRENEERTRQENPNEIKLTTQVKPKNIFEKCAFCGGVCSRGATNCVACAQKSKKKDVEAQQTVRDIGLDYIMVEYTNNKDVAWRCSNDHVFKMSVADLKRGRRCVLCRRGL